MLDPDIDGAPAERRDGPRRSLAQTLALLAAVPLVVSVCAGLAQKTGDPALKMTLAAGGTAVVLTLLAVAFARRGPAWERLGLGATRLPALHLGLLAVGVLALSEAADLVIHHAGLQGRSVLADFHEALAGLRGWKLAAALAGIGLAPAVGEELFFRGLVQRGLERRVRPSWAITVSSAAFAIAHVDPVHTSAAFVLGLYLGSAAYLAGSIRASMLCHAVNNTVSVLGIAFWPGFEPPGPAYVAPAALIAALVLIAARRASGRSRDGLVTGHHRHSEEMAATEKQRHQPAP